MNYTTLASNEALITLVDALQKRHITATVVENRAEALVQIREHIPAGASVMNGSSRTLEEIGYIELLKSGNHPWVNPKDEILKEADPVKQAELRKHSVLSEYYLGSVHALSEAGEIVIASNSGSQMPHIVYTSPNVLFVVGAQKITKDLPSAFDRLEKHVVPLEDVRMKSVGYPGTFQSKTLVFRGEHPAMGRKFHMILVKEPLGF
jgi:L-lactate utilization protein LutC